MSNSPKVERKLAAIMFTDIAGFTESMSYDEQQAMNAVKKKRSIIQPLIKEHNGVFVKEIGDGTLSYFGSAIDASTCAVKLQELTYDEEHLNIRVGLHIGDIVFDGQDVFGEGVNIASRLESLSPVGGVCVSKNVYDELENKKEFNGTSLGLQSLKGVGRLVEVYALKGDKLKEPDTTKYKETEVQKHTDDEVPSIAIIPFENKGAEEDVFYAYGISADLISDCSSAGLIRVAGKKQIEEALHLPQDELAKKLDVRYMANGELWRMGNMFQLSTELYDTKEQKVVWSDRWQENWENLHTIKDNLSDGLLKALDTKPNVKQKEYTTNPKAYSFYLEARHKYYKRKTLDDKNIVIQLLKKAINLDENFLRAKLFIANIAWDEGKAKKAIESTINVLYQAEKNDDIKTLSICLNNLGFYYNNSGENENAEPYLMRLIEIAEKQNDDFNLGMGYGNLSVTILNKSKNNIEEIKRAEEYNAKSLSIFYKMEDKSWIAKNTELRGVIYQYKGDYDSALKYFYQSLEIFVEIDDTDRIINNLMQIGAADNFIGDYPNAIKNYNRALEIADKLEEKSLICIVLYDLGKMYCMMKKYEKSIEFLKQYIKLMKELKKNECNKKLNVLSYLYLSYKGLGIQYNEKDIRSLLLTKKDTENFDLISLNFVLNKLLEDKSYLETAYNQIQEKVDAMDDELKEKFLTYPIPKQIIEEYNKVFNPLS